MKVRQSVFRAAIALITFFVGVSMVLISLNSRINELQKHPIMVIEDKNKPLTDDSRPAADLREDYAVFSAVLATFDFSETIVISDYAFDTQWSGASDIDRRYYDLSEETVNDYQNKNKKPHKLENKFTIPGKIFFLSREEENVLFPKGGAGWDKFYQKYPKAKGIIYLSNAGFNQNKTRALVYISQQCRTCNDSYYSLEKIESKWIILRKTRGI